MRKLLAGIALAMGAMTASANASVVGFTLDIGGSDVNVPDFTLTNTSTSGAELTGISFTIGDTSRHFDFIQFTPGSTTDATPTGAFPDTINGGSRSDFFTISFTGNSFDGGEAFNFQADVDRDPASNTVENYTTVFGNNGIAANAVATVSFLLGGQVIELSDTFPDISALNYTLSAQQSVSAVPVPAALPLLATGLAGLAFMGRRRKNAS